MKFLHNPWIKLFLVSIVLTAIFLGFRAADIDFSTISSEQFKETIRSLGAWGPVLYIVIYLLRPLILFPAGLLSASAGFIWGMEGLIYLLVAANISAAAEFLIARSFGRKLVEKYVSQGKIARLDEKIERHGFMTVLLIRLVPNVAWDIQNITLGLTRVSFGEYLLATFIGIIPGSFAFVFFGSSLIDILTDPNNMGKVVTAGIVLVLIVLLQKFLKRKHGGKI